MKSTLKKYYRWLKMLSGKSEFHQPQLCPRNLTSDSLFYPNDLSSKLSWDGVPDKNGIPMNRLSDGQYFYFPISLCQKAIALYENNQMVDFLQLTSFIVSLIDENGGLDCWSKSGKGTITNYSSMAQGQVISVLFRAHVLTREDKYVSAAKSAYDCLMNIENSIFYREDGVVFFDETPKPGKDIILNGWIFTLWGILDFNRLVNGHDENYEFLEYSHQLAKVLHRFDNGFWSLYSDGGSIASPFYHDLHIEQLKAMYIITNISEFNEYAEKFSSYKVSRCKKNYAFIKKAFQKITEKSFNEFVE